LTLQTTIWLAAGAQASLLPDASSVPEGVELREATAEECGRGLEDVASGEGVLLGLEGLSPNAFVLALGLKMRFHGDIRVGLLLPGDADRACRALSRYCMVDRLFTPADLEGVRWPDLLARLSNEDRPRPRKSLDDMLADLEAKLDEGAGALAERVMKGLATGREQHFLAKVVDPESGLFDGPFMAFKVEEEFKRSLRFHDPLTVLLVDLPGSAGLGGEERGLVLGKVAGVFLNQCRDIDLVGRYDDSSFLLILPETSEEGALVLARRILDTLEAEVESPTPLDPAIAVVSVPKPGVAHKDDLLDLARLTLVQAWSGKGKERVKVAP